MCLARIGPGPYQIQAAINAVHSDARSIAETDWKHILALYDPLLELAPSPVVALAAIARCDNAREKNFLQRQCDSIARN